MRRRDVRPPESPMLSPWRAAFRSRRAYASREAESLGFESTTQIRAPVKDTQGSRRRRRRLRQDPSIGAESEALLERPHEAVLTSARPRGQQAWPLPSRWAAVAAPTRSRARQDDRARRGGRPTPWRWPLTLVGCVMQLLALPNATPALGERHFRARPGP